MAWDLAVGETAHRTDLHAGHGGTTSRGISAPAKSVEGRDIMLWWRPERGEAFGYDDGWSADGAFYFSGMGQVGDQSFGRPTPENGRVRDHVENNDRIRLLRYLDTNLVRYLGELRLDPHEKFRFRDGPSRTQETRKIIQFRFLPVGEVLRTPGDLQREPITEAPVVDRLPGPPPAPTRTDIEALGKRSFERLVKVQRQNAQRVESILVHDFAQWLRERGVDCDGLKIPYQPEARNLRADLFVLEPRVLVEAKSSSAREHIRMAIGQLLDYGRYVVPAAQQCVLTQTRPTDDMLELLGSLAIGSVWKVRNGFDGTPSWLPRHAARRDLRVISLSPGDGW